MKPEKITLHWTAGTYGQTFNDYHFCILGDGTVKQTRSVTVPGAHTWRRNTGNIGIALCAMAKGYPVQAIQVERMARLCAELAHKYDIPLNAIRDHAHYARLDRYFPLRWDIGSLCEVVRGKIAWYGEHIRGSRDYELIREVF